MASLQDFLASLSLSHYLTAFTNKGYTEVSQLLSIPDDGIDTALAALNMLKGHAYKLKKCLETMKRGEPLPGKKPKVEDGVPPPASQLRMPTNLAVQKPGLRQTPSQLLASPRAPLPSPGISSPLKPNVSLTKDVERLMTKLADIEQVRDDLVKAKEMILTIDVDRYKRSLQQVEFVQKTLRAMEEVSAELSALDGAENAEVEE